MVIAKFEHGPVILQVKVQIMRALVDSLGFFHLVPDAFQLGNKSIAIALEGQTQGRGFQNEAIFREAFQIGAAQSEDKGALLRENLDQPFHFHLRQSVADRRFADIQAFGELLLGQGFTKGEFALTDSGSEFFRRDIR